MREPKAITNLHERREILNLPTAEITMKFMFGKPNLRGLPSLRLVLRGKFRFEAKLVVGTRVKRHRAVAGTLFTGCSGVEEAVLGTSLRRRARFWGGNIKAGHVGMSETIRVG
jgi:hypothetical protein